MSSIPLLFRYLEFLLTVSMFFIVASPVWSDPEAIHVAPIYADSGDIAELPGAIQTTKTVFGFLDFITTVSNTVMVFTSQGGMHPNEINGHEFIEIIQVLEIHQYSMIEFLSVRNLIN